MTPRFWAQRPCKHALGGRQAPYGPVSGLQKCSPSLLARERVFFATRLAMLHGATEEGMLCTDFRAQVEESLEFHTNPSTPIINRHHHQPQGTKTKPTDPSGTPRVGAACQLRRTPSHPGTCLFLQAPRSWLEATRNLEKGVPYINAGGGGGARIRSRERV